MVNSSYDPLIVEKEIQEFWDKDLIYNQQKEKLKSGKPFYFLDGPPYTSGSVHIGTAWNKCLKDSILRYKRMKGFNVWDRAGYDMHGLPTAHAVMKKLHLQTKDDIFTFGVDKFVEACSEFSVKNLEKMNSDFIRLGVWMDFENAYQSIENDFIEGEWWLIKKAHERGRLYEGLRTMSWCASCETALAKHELEYKEISDTSIFVKFKVVGTENEYLIIWTTTPWTLAFNLAVMVNPDLDYVKAKVDNEVWIVSKALVAPVVQTVADKKYTLIEEFKGSELEGLEYDHPWKEIIDFSEIKKNAQKVHSVILSSEYVDVSAGSGLVHCAPGCGPEDYEVGHRNHIPPFNIIDEKGVFPKEMGIFSGKRAKADDAFFIKELNESLIEKTTVEHEYAHCWRCHKPVVFKTTKQWFFKIEDLVPNMREVNKNIKWQPEWAGSRQFDSWLQNLRDNSITKQRFWGCPLPVWRCNKCEDYTVVGSKEELETLASNVVPKDLHKPFIDEVKIKCKCGEFKERIPDILDVWVDSGTTSWNCLRYPKETKDFKKYFPADFILEGKDQIRGWFNLLLVASMVSMEKPSFKSVYMHGMIKDSSGRKMSKSLGNYILPEEVIGKHGADVFRYYTIGGANPALDLNYNGEDAQNKHRNLIVLWNLHSLLISLSKESDINPSKILLNEDIMEPADSYILSKLNSCIKNVSEAYEDYRLNEPSQIVEDFYLELSRTYVQSIRERFVDAGSKEKELILAILYKSLINTITLAAPIIPFMTEAIYQNLKKAFIEEKKSVHHLDWPSFDPVWIDEPLEEYFEIGKQIIATSSNAREKCKLGMRWPVLKVIVESKDEKVVNAVKKLSKHLKIQLNSKDIQVFENMEGVKIKVTGNFSKIGPDFAELSPRIIAYLNTISSETILSNMKNKGSYKFKLEGKEIELKNEHLNIEKVIPDGFESAESKLGTVYLDRTRNTELDSEGFSREIVRRVQIARKDAGLNKKDRITLFIECDKELEGMIWKDHIKEKVGAEGFTLSDTSPKKDFEFTDKPRPIRGHSVKVYLDKVK